MASREKIESGFNESYADQTGHRLRGIHEELRMYFDGVPIKCLGGSARVVEDNKRRMKRITKDGKNKKLI